MGMSIFCLFKLVMIHNKLAAKFNWLPKSKIADNLTPSHLILNAIVLCFCTAIDFSYLRYTHIYFNCRSLAFYPVGFDFFTPHSIFEAALLVSSGLYTSTQWKSHVINSNGLVSSAAVGQRFSTEKIKGGEEGKHFQLILSPNIPTKDQSVCMWQIETARAVEGWSWLLHRNTHRGSASSWNALSLSRAY